MYLSWMSLASCRTTGLPVGDGRRLPRRRSPLRLGRPAGGRRCHRGTWRRWAARWLPLCPGILMANSTRLAAAGHSSHVFGILTGGQNLFQDRPQLYLAQNTAGLYAGKHLLQAAHIGGKVLHLAQALVDLLQLGADRAERLADAALAGWLPAFRPPCRGSRPAFGCCRPGWLLMPLQQGRRARRPSRAALESSRFFRRVSSTVQLGQQGIVGGASGGRPRRGRWTSSRAVLAAAFWRWLLGQHGGKVPQRWRWWCGSLSPCIARSCSASKSVSPCNTGVIALTTSSAVGPWASVVAAAHQ